MGSCHTLGVEIPKQILAQECSLWFFPSLFSFVVPLQQEKIKRVLTMHMEASPSKTTPMAAPLTSESSTQGLSSTSTTGLTMEKSTNSKLARFSSTTQLPRR